MANDDEVKLEWHYLGELNKLKLGDKSLFTFDTEGKQIKPFPGIYVWIWEGGKENYVHYVGQSKDIWKRLETEVSALIGGAWLAYNLKPKTNLYELKKKIFLTEPNTENCYSGVIESNCYCGVTKEHYSPNRGKKNSISAMMNKDRIYWASKMLENMHIAIAKIEDKERRLNVEATLIHGLRKHLKLSDKIPRYILDVFFGRVTKEPTEAFSVEHGGDGGKLPAELIEITKWEK